MGDIVAGPPADTGLSNSAVPEKPTEPGLSSLVDDAVPPLADPADPPDGGYGWVCVGCNFTVNAFTWGLSAV